MSSKTFCVIHCRRQTHPHTLTPSASCLPASCLSCLCVLRRYWGELHVPGTPAPFKLRGASYLADRTKVDGGMPQFVLGSVDLVETAGPTQHISRFLPAVRWVCCVVVVVVCYCMPNVCAQ